MILSTVFNFHELAIEDCTTVDIEEAKLDDYEDYLFIVFHSVFFDRTRLRFDIVELDMFFGENYVITYHKRPVSGINQLRRRLETDIDFISHGSDEILHAIVDSLVDNYTSSFKELEKIIYKIETEILSEPTQRTFNDLFRLKRSLINMQRIVVPEEEVINFLGNTEHTLIKEENQVYFQDVHDHISTIRRLLTSYVEMVSGTMDTYVSITNHRMTSVMQTLTMISTIMLPLTLIASIYGMNFEHLPFKNSPLAFPIFIFLCVTIAGSMLWYFKKQGWF